MNEHSIGAHLTQDENLGSSPEEIIETDIEERHQLSPDQAVELYLYGPNSTPKYPAGQRSDVEAEMYEDYMGGAPEPGEFEDQP